MHYLVHYKHMVNYTVYAKLTLLPLVSRIIELLTT